MPLRMKIVLFLCSAFLLGVPQASLAQCSQTLSVGANVASAVSSAATGSIICLNSGNYGTVNLFNLSRTGFVTLQSASGKGAQMSPQVGNSRFIRFTSMTLTDMLVNSCSISIELWNSVFLANSGGLVFNYDTSCSGVTDMALVVDGVTFDRIQNSLFEGRLSIRGVDGLKIRNSVFSGVSNSSQSDGIQIVGGSRDIEIGPGNRFSGILEGLCGGVHCDAIQDYGGGPNNRIFGNLFENGDTFIMMPDGSSNLTVENNIFNGAGVGYDFNLQFGSATNLIFRHNTLRDSSIAIDSKTGLSASTNAQMQHNILVGNTTVKTSGGSGCTGCNFSFNLFDAGGSIGTNNVIGTPTFAGGSSPTTWTGWQLTAGSPGKNAGSDGQDMGTTFYGGGGTTLQAPVAPTNLTIKVP